MCERVVVLWEWSLPHFLSVVVFICLEAGRASEAVMSVVESLFA